MGGVTGVPAGPAGKLFANSVVQNYQVIHEDPWLLIGVVLALLLLVIGAVIFIRRQR